MISTLDEYLNEIIAYENGKPITRRSTIPISRINFLREHWPAAVGYGYRKAVRDAPKAAARARPNVKLPKGVMP